MKNFLAEETKFFFFILSCLENIFNKFKVWFIIKYTTAGIYCRKIKINSIISE